jgi:CheY-like chemotaxis protein
MGGTRKNVLWVDDEIEFLRSHIMFLETRGYSVVPTYSGEEALQLLRDEPGRFDIVLLDEQMPGMDGLTTLEGIKESWPELPVVMVTKSEEEQLMEDALGKKIDGYLTKPVNPSQILSVCKALLDSPRIISTAVTQRFVRDYSANRLLLAREMGCADWARLHANLAAWDIELDKTDNEGLRQNHAGQRSDCNAAFTRFITERYAYWMRGEKRPPLLSPQVVARHVAPLLKAGCKTRFVILDCMRLDQYLIVEAVLRRLFEVERHAYFSILPTAPRYARLALLAGMYPLDVARQYPQRVDDGAVEPHTEAGFDRGLLEKNLAAQGVALSDHSHFAHLRSAADAAEYHDGLGALADAQLVTVSVDFFHMLTHGRSSSAVLQDITQDESSLRGLTNSWFQYSPVLQILREFARSNATVVLTSDHGTTLCNRGVELYGAQGLERQPRYQFGERVTSDERLCLFVQEPERFRLPAETPKTACILATGGCFFTEPRDTDGRPERTQSAFYYGGISMEEMIVPLAILKPKPGV